MGSNATPIGSELSTELFYVLHVRNDDIIHIFVKASKKMVDSNAEHSEINSFAMDDPNNNANIHTFGKLNTREMVGRRASLAFS